MSNNPPPSTGSSAVVPAVADPAETEQPQGRKRIGLIAGIAGVVIVLLLLGIIVGGAFFPDAARTARDIAIIFLALSSFLVVAALVILIILVSRLVIMLQVEIKPLLESLNETTRTVRGTATFMSENMVKPVIQTAGYVEGARRFLEVLVGLRPRKPKPPKHSKQP